MSLLQKIGAVGGGTSGLTNPSPWLLDVMGGPKSSAGVSVTPESALSLSTFYACLRNIAEDIGGLPFKVFENLKPRGRKPAPDHSLYPIIHDAPNQDMSAMTFWEMLIHWSLGWGNGFAEIVTNGRNTVLELTPIHPGRVTVFRDSETRKLLYQVRNNDGSTVMLLPHEMFHLRGIGPEWGGYSVARLGAESIGRAIATQEFSASFFGNGSTFSGIFTHPGKLDSDAQKRLRESWPSGLPSAHKPMFLEGGMSWQQLGINPEDAQMLETIKFTVEDIARWFRMPLHKVQSMDSATFSNIEHQAREYHGDTLLPWIRRIENEVTRKLLAQADRKKFSVKFVIRGLLRGDLKTQGEYYTKMVGIGVLSRNEVRELENMNPVPGGDEFLIPLNMAPATEKKPNEPDGDNDTDDKDDEKDKNDARRRQVEGLKKAHARVFADAAGRLAAKETKALERAVKRCKTYGLFMDWAEGFYLTHDQHCVDTMLELSLCMAEVLCLGFGLPVLTKPVADVVKEGVEGIWSLDGKDHVRVQIESVPNRLEELKTLAAKSAVFMPDMVVSRVCAELGVTE